MNAISYYELITASPKYPSAPYYRTVIAKWHFFVIAGEAKQSCLSPVSLRRDTTKQSSCTISLVSFRACLGILNILPWFPFPFSLIALANYKTTYGRRHCLSSPGYKPDCEFVQYKPMISSFVFWLGIRERGGLWGSTPFGHANGVEKKDHRLIGEICIRFAG